MLSVLRTVVSVAGAFLNRVRGGLFDIPFNKLFYPLFFGILCSYAGGWNIPGFVSGFLAGYVGQQIAGWGAYIGALTVGAKPAAECPMIDDIVNAARISFKGHSWYLKDYPRAWGFAALALRGLVWTFLTGLAFQSPAIMASGLLMPVCYLLPTLALWYTKHNADKTAWNIGEWIWGFVLTGITAYKIIG